jgi:hypothetical protein
MRKTARLSALFLACILLPMQVALAQDTPVISALTRIDRDFMAEQRRAVDSIARGSLGRQIRGDKANDLDVLQQILDRRLVDPGDAATLQAMGVVMGGLLSRELGMPWVIYEDKLGRSRALRIVQTDHYLFPVTMISRRYEVGAAVDVEAIYDRAVSLMQPHLPARPFRYD